jgi:acyl-coenzyme A thioesterase PaaI-like protein
MNTKLSQYTDKLLKNSSQAFALKIIEKIFNIGIPFNFSRSFKLIELSEVKTKIKMPCIRANKNHLGGMHACAIATLGEYAAGLSLIKRFGSSDYRLIMKELKTDYIKQASNDLYGEVTIEKAELDQVESIIATDEKASISVLTNILNAQDEVVAVVQTEWQLKGWQAVTFKGNRVL